MEVKHRDLRRGGETTEMNFRKGAFDIYGECPCGKFRESAPFGKLFHIHKAVCPKCGTSKDKWELRIGRYVWEGILWKPWTWPKYDFEYKKGKSEE